MRTTSKTQAGFLNPRTLAGFLLFFAGVTLAFFAFSSLVGQSALAQALSQKGNGASAPAYNGPRRDLRPVVPVRSRPLREVPPRRPLLTYARVHPEPVQPQFPNQAGG